MAFNTHKHNVIIIINIIIMIMIVIIITSIEQSSYAFGLDLALGHVETFISVAWTKQRINCSANVFGQLLVLNH